MAFKYFFTYFDKISISTLTIAFFLRLLRLVSFNVWGITHISKLCFLILEIVRETRLDGVIATNTTIDRDNLKTDKNKIDEIGNGGLSGKPLKDRSTEVIKYLSLKSNKSFSIIGVGGISSANDAKEKLDAGADLVQIYTGFIYEGPSLVKKINTELINTIT